MVILIDAISIGIDKDARIDDMLVALYFGNA